ncbi:alpha/beta fold hydrolase [Tahibacter amnicola]|uniref:Alpha/beta hydrolase n=1 Tax=Tahibacter amnicola TaxID=2976241 RepID=A0ABY6BK90_9GAMM|nr:alpha/beta hydrolase [Tahibacter amnicola]UXI69011.1 alpha/beta hydrolase [Tahibacter amnicola]
MTAPVALNVVTLGQPGRLPVIFVHGMAGTAGLWIISYAFWLLEHCHVIAYDQRGHGLSPATPQGYRLVDQADDIERVRQDHAQGPAIVVGYSYGGHIATQWAMRYPAQARGLVVIDSPPLPLAPAQIAELLHGVPQALGGEAAPDGPLVNRIRDRLDDSIRQRRRPLTRMKARLEALRETTFERDVLADVPFADDAYRAIRCPTLLLYATRAGNLAFANRQQKLIPDCRTRLVDAEHDLVTRNTEAVREHLRDFLREVADSPRSDVVQRDRGSR